MFPAGPCRLRSRHGRPGGRLYGRRQLGPIRLLCVLSTERVGMARRTLFPVSADGRGSRIHSRPRPASLAFYRMKKVSIIDQKGFERVPCRHSACSSRWTGSFHGDAKYQATFGGCHEKHRTGEFSAPPARTSAWPSKCFPDYVWQWVDDPGAVSDAAGFRAPGGPVRRQALRRPCLPWARRDYLRARHPAEGNGRGRRWRRPNRCRTRSKGRSNRPGSMSRAAARTGMQIAHPRGRGAACAWSTALDGRARGGMVSRP